MCNEETLRTVLHGKFCMFLQSTRDSSLRFGKDGSGNVEAAQRHGIRLLLRNDMSGTAAVTYMPPHLRVRCTAKCTEGRHRNTLK